MADDAASCSTPDARGLPLAEPAAAAVALRQEALPAEPSAGAGSVSDAQSLRHAKSSATVASQGKSTKKRRGGRQRGNSGAQPLAATFVAMQSSGVLAPAFAAAEERGAIDVLAHRALYLKPDMGLMRGHHASECISRVVVPPARNAAAFVVRVPATYTSFSTKR